MHLHEAMQVVLLGCLNQTATTQAVSEEIESRGFYRQHSGIAATAEQISARAQNYPKLFSRAGRGSIKLVAAVI